MNAPRYQGYRDGKPVQGFPSNPDRTYAERDRDSMNHHPEPHHPGRWHHRHRRVRVLGHQRHRLASARGARYTSAVAVKYCCTSDEDID